MTTEQLLARPIPGKWSTQEVVCHLADYEPIYADRMKRVIALKEPELLPGDPGLFAARLAYDHRDVEEELAFVELTRKQMARILRALKPEDFQRFGRHSRDGALTLEGLLQRSRRTSRTTSSSSRRRGERWREPIHLLDTGRPGLQPACWATAYRPSRLIKPGTLAGTKSTLPDARAARDSLVQITENWLGGVPRRTGCPGRGGEPPVTVSG